MSDYDEWEDEDEDDNDYWNEDNACVECGRPGFDGCCCCGLPLCPMHNEIQAGFCSDCPTPEWIAEQEGHAHAFKQDIVIEDRDDIPF